MQPSFPGYCLIFYLIGREAGRQSYDNCAEKKVHNLHIFLQQVASTENQLKRQESQTFKISSYDVVSDLMFNAVGMC